MTADPMSEVYLPGMVINDTCDPDQLPYLLTNELPRPDERRAWAMNNNRAAGLRMASIVRCTIAPLAHCASTRSALDLDACTQLYSSTKGLARRRRRPAVRAIGVIARRTQCCMALWSSKQMHSSKGRASEVVRYRDSFARSLKRTCVADGWNMVSFEQNARGVVTSIGWRLAANAVVGAHRARRGAWPKLAHI